MSNHSEYSCNSKQNAYQNSQFRANSSKLRPTSGMNNYLKGKLPDCFLIEASPQGRRAQPLEEGAAYVDNGIRHSNSPFTKQSD